LQILELPKSASFRSQSLLVVLTLLCLLPFSNKAFHIDDTLFVWTAQQIAHHPLDPYGFKLNWYRTPAPMSRETKNPPLAAYYATAAGRLAGWSERSLHFAFLLPAVVLILGTYHLARRFTEYPLVAAAATLLTPGVLVSSTSVMCDTMMAALSVVAVSLKKKGLGIEGLGLTGWGSTGWGLTGWGLTGWGLTGWGSTGWRRKNQDSCWPRLSLLPLRL
jgi:hypothetical protein